MLKAFQDRIPTAFSALLQLLASNNAQTRLLAFEVSNSAHNFAERGQFTNRFLPISLVCLCIIFNGQCCNWR